ncbi:N-acetylneuraminate synthase family protein [Alphaproteobacteria bacterium]|nr:N-acetylneuraminate synthase family protein [Alphaproteobacteria bacterium]MDB2431932.1 N-acetylneuraminate synthase family protein [Alphaproteobacteria bacterium]MDB2575103.1 N-acetylneuraminate synthase family protein [Alphaproteobacteria bacterium]MDB2656029.1 N-acetylneuraminate synthase family protein [Alphaproteobacteria bacterium]
MGTNLKSRSVVPSDISILEAMRKIDANKGGVLFLVDHKGHLKGSLTDGDIRRGLLTKKLELDSAAILAANKTPFSVEVGASGFGGIRSQLDFPILDGHGRVLDVISSAGEVVIGDRLISSDCEPFFIAEIGNNHNGDIKLARDLVDKAIESGADAVKFQLRNLDEVYGSESPSSDVGVEYTMQLLSEVNLSPDEMHNLIKYSKSKGVLVGCTPFDLRSLHDLSSFDIDFIKIASADLTNTSLLEAAVKWFTPLVVSTGMSTLEEIERASKLLKRSKCPFVLLHCNSTYPTPFKDVGLNFMPKLSKYSSSGAYGYSGHERGYEVPIAAVSLGASIIEKHFTVDRSMRGNDHKVSLLPDEFSQMVTAARNVKKSLGSAGRTISQGEMINRENLAKSIVAARDIGVGECLKISDLEFKSPGQGIQPDRADELVGKVLVNPLSQGENIFYSHFEQINESGFKSKFKALEFSRPTGIPVRFHDVNKMIDGSGLKFVEFHLTNKDLYFDLDNVQFPSSIKSIAVHAPELFDGDNLLDLASSDASVRDRSLRDMSKVVEVATYLGGLLGQVKVPVVVNVGGQTTGDFIPPDLRSELYTNVGKSLEKISSPSVDLLIQTMPPFPWHFGGQSFHNIFVNPEETLEFCKEWGFGICFDISHSAMAAAWLERSVIDWIELLGPWIRHMHLSDSAGVDGEGLQIGSGDLDFEMICEKLNYHTPNISFIPEIWQGHVDNGAEAFKALCEFHRHGLR